MDCVYRSPTPALGPGPPVSRSAGEGAGRSGDAVRGSDDRPGDHVLRLCRARGGCRRVGGFVPQPGALGALSDRGLFQRGRPVRADRRRVPGDDPRHRLCRRGRGPVSLCRDDARYRLCAACAAGLCAISRSAPWSGSSCWPSSSSSSAAGWSPRSCRALPRAAGGVTTDATPGRSATFSTPAISSRFRRQG